MNYSPLKKKTNPTKMEIPTANNLQETQLINKILDIPTDLSVSAFSNTLCMLFI